MVKRLCSIAGYFCLFVLITHWLRQTNIAEGVTSFVGVWGIVSYIALIPSLWTKEKKETKAVKRRKTKGNSPWGVLASASWILWTLVATALLLLSDFGLFRP